MSLFWYPEINEKIKFEEKPDKDVLLSSYIRYFLARIQSMFKYDGLPDTIPQKWLENYLLCNGYCVWIKNGDKLVVTFAGVGGKPDIYYIPTECIVTNPYLDQSANKTYTRDVDCVLMVNDTYAQGILPLLKKYCSMLVENELTMGIADIMSRASFILSAADDQTKQSAELFLKRLWEGYLGVIGEAPFLIGNQDKALNINELSKANGTLTNLIEYQQYLKASLYNELGLQSNYNMKREAINSNESQLNEDMLHPLIDDMLRERKEALEKVNKMFGTNITVEFNSAWEINEREEEAAIEQMEAGTEAKAGEVLPEDNSSAELTEETPEDIEDTEDTPDTPEEAEAVEVTITENAIEEIAEAVADKVEDIIEGGDTNENAEDNA